MGGHSQNVKHVDSRVVEEHSLQQPIFEMVEISSSHGQDEENQNLMEVCSGCNSL